MDSSEDVPTNVQASSSNTTTDPQTSSSDAPTKEQASAGSEPVKTGEQSNPVRRVNCMVLQDEKTMGKLAYDRSAVTLKNCKKDDFHFDIKSTAEGDVGIFSIVHDRQLLRQNQSKPFEKGSITKEKKNLEVNKTTCIVSLRKTPDISLQDLFSTAELNKKT